MRHRRQQITMSEPNPKLRAMQIVGVALDLKAEHPVVLDMRKLTAYTDTFIILSGRSDRQVRSIADAIVHAIKSNGEQPLGVEGLDDGNWILIDCNDVIVHIFDPETRERYDLERLWRDAPRLDLNLELGSESSDSNQAPFTKATTKATTTATTKATTEATDEDDAADPAA